MPSDQHPADETLLDPELMDAIAAAIEPEPLDRGVHDRIKTKLLRRIATHTTEQHLTVQPLADGWQPFGEGLSMRVLHEADGVMSYLVRLAPKASLPAHRHPIDEECVVLEGEVQIGSLRVAAGGFHLGRKNILHDRLRSADGAVIFLRGAVPHPAQLV